MDDRIRQAVEGDETALGQLLFERHDRLLRLIRGKIAADIQASVDADDILQQAFVDAFRNIRRFQPKSDAAFNRWLDAIVEHRLIDAARRERAEKRGGKHRRIQKPTTSHASSIADLFDLLSAEIPTPSAFAARAEGVQALQVCLAGLPDGYREAIQLHHLDGKGREQVAVEMNRGADEVRGLLYRARKKLRDALGASSLYLTKK